MEEAQPGSWEALLHEHSARDRLIIFNDDEPDEMLEPRGHRAIGVVHDPRRERFGNYVPTVLPDRYDAVLYLDRTTALQTLAMAVRDDGEPPDTSLAGCEGALTGPPQRADPLRERTTPQAMRAPELPAGSVR